jgi:hypothetical protein
LVHFFIFNIIVNNLVQLINERKGIAQKNPGIYRKIWEFTEKSGNLQNNLGIYRKIQKTREFYRKNLRKSKKNLKTIFKIMITYPLLHLLLNLFLEHFLFIYPILLVAHF